MIGEAVAEARRAFYAALRSGQYVQGRGQLERVLDRDGEIERFNCCLGVACRVAMENGIPLTAESSWGTIIFSGNGLVLPYSVSEWLGFPAVDPYIGRAEKNVLVTASEANDIYGWSFARIADAFEATYPADPASER